MFRLSGPAGDPGPSGNDVFGDDGYERLDSMGEGSVTQRSARQPAYPGPYDEWPMGTARLIRETQPYREQSGGLCSNEFYNNPAPRFKGAAFRDRETGEIFESGRYHNPDNLPERAIIGRDREGYPLGKPSLESGFIDDAGNFYTREEALNMRTGEMEDDPETVESASSNWDIPGGGDYDAIGAEEAQSYQGLAASRDGERLIAALLRNAWDAEGSPMPCPNISDQFPGLSHDILMPLGVQNVPVNKISGSAVGNQWPSVDDKKGQEYLTHWFNTGTFNDLDPVKVLKVQDTYWVEGDHYRPALLKELDPYGSLKATVTEVFIAKGDGLDSTGTPATDNWYTSFAAKKTAAHPDFGLYGLKEWDEDPVTVEMFYSREWRSWAVQMKDANGVQVGDCQWLHDKSYAKQVKQKIEDMIARTRTASRHTADTEQPAQRMADWYPRLSDQVVNLGIQQVPVASVQGSAIKDAWPSEDEARGDRLSTLLEEQGNFDSLKPMKMLKVDDTYWAVDGHHRVSLMKKYNPAGTLQALVTERFPQDDSAQPSYMQSGNYTAAPMAYWARKRQANEASDLNVGNASDMPTGMMAFMDDSDGETGWADATVHPNAENRDGLEKSMWTEKTASANRNDVLDFDAKVRMGGRRIRLGASEEEIWTRISEIAPELTDEQVAKYQNMLAMSIDPDKVLYAIETDGVWGL